MEIIQLILGYVKNLQTTYGKYLPLIDTLKNIVSGKLKVIDCDVYYPSEEEVLKELSKKDKSLYEEFKKIVSNNTKNLSNVSNLTENTDNITNTNNISSEITAQEIAAVFLQEECIIPSTDNNTNKEQDLPFTKEELQVLFESIANQCDISGIDFDNINKDVSDETFTDKEVKEAMEECPPEVQDELNDGNGFNDNFKPTDTTQSETNLTQPNTNGDIQAVFDSIKPFMSDTQAKCNQKLIDSSKTLNEKVKKYTELSQKELSVRKKKDFYYPMFKMYERYEKFAKKVNSINPLITLKRIDTSLKRFSTEIKINNFKKDRGVQFFDIDIIESNTPKGIYYDSESKYSNKIIDSVKNNKTDNIDSILIDMEKEKVKDIDNFNKSFMKDIDTSLLLLETAGIIPVGMVNMKNVRKDIVAQKNKYKKLYDDSVKEYNDLLKEKQELKVYIDEFEKNLEKSLKDSGCIATPEPETKINSDDENFKGISVGVPTINDLSWWKKFCTLASNVALLPIPLFTNSNDIYLNLSKYPKMDFAYPKGSIVLDDDIIPRFLFYPIGLVIPTPFSLDGLYRIPIPPRIRPLTVQKIESPLNAIRKELSGKIEALIGMEEIRKTMGKFYRGYQDIPNAPDVLISHFMEITGLNAKYSPEAVLKEYNTNKTDLIKYIDTLYGDIERNKNTYKNQGRKKQEEIVNEVRKKVLGFFSIITKANKDIDNKMLVFRKELEKVNPDSYINKYKTIFTQVEALAKLFDSCTGVNTSKSVKKANKSKDIYKLVSEMQRYRGEAASYKIPGIKKLAIPNFDVTNYFNYGQDEKLQHDFVGEMNNRLQVVLDFIIGIDININQYFDDVVRGIFLETRIDPLSITKGLKIPKAALRVLPFLNIDFPECIIVPCIAQTGIFPYPIIIILNLGNVPIGPVRERSMMMLTIDFKNPLKLVKNNPMSKTLDIGSLFEATLNATLGYGVDLLNGVETSSVYLKNINICPEKIGLNFSDIQAQLLDTSKISAPWLKLKKDLLNSNYYPNPKYICEVIKGNNKKEELQEILGSMNLSPNVPPEVSRLINTNVSDYKNGKVIIDNSTNLFPLKNYLDFQDIFQLDVESQKQLNIEDMGISKKILVDLFPQITQTLPFLIDDLPDWKRLNGKNIPFLLFLLQFANTVRRGCKLPIPEVVPIPD